MEEIEPKFPVTVYRRSASWLPWIPGRIEADVIQSLEELEEDLEWIDTRVDKRIWLVDSDGTRFDAVINWLDGIESKFFPFEEYVPGNNAHFAPDEEHP